MPWKLRNSQLSTIVSRHAGSVCLLTASLSQVDAVVDHSQLGASCEPAWSELAASLEPAAARLEPAAASLEPAAASLEPAFSQIEASCSLLKPAAASRQPGWGQPGASCSQSSGGVISAMEATQFTTQHNRFKTRRIGLSIDSVVESG